jgi:hypothetical protein
MLHGHADGGLRVRRPSLNALLIAVLTVLAAVIYGAYSLSRYYQFNAGTYDLVIFDQAIHSYAHSQPGISIVKGLHNGFGPQFSVLGDHFPPILAVLAPLYWVYNGPQDLLIAQAALFAIALPPVWVFSRRALGGGPRGTAGADLVSVAYAVSWPAAAAADSDFHEAAFAPVVTAVALERLQAAGLLCAMAIMFVPRSALGAVFQPGFFDLATPRIRAEQAAVAAVPPGVVVATANKIGPDLVARDAVILRDGDGSMPPLLAPWVIATTSEVQFTFSTIAQEQSGRDGVALLERHGCKVVFDRLGYYVLHRGDFPARHGKS